MAPHRVAHVVRFELGRTLRDGWTYAGVMAFAALLTLGAWLYWQSLPPRQEGGRLFGEAYLLALTVCCHVGIARDRTHQFDRYLVANFVKPAELYFGKVAATMIFLIAFASLSFGLALIASLGSLTYAAHHAALFLLFTIVLLPWLVITELLVTTRNPVPLVIIAFFAFLAVYSRTADVRPVLDSLGLTNNLELRPALLRSVVALLLTAACYPLYRIRLGAPTSPS